MYVLISTSSELVNLWDRAKSQQQSSATKRSVKLLIALPADPFYCVPPVFLQNNNNNNNDCSSHGCFEACFRKMNKSFINLKKSSHLKGKLLNFPLIFILGIIFFGLLCLLFHCSPIPPTHSNKRQFYPKKLACIDRLLFFWGLGKS
jgi:hypothetical protein